MSAWILAALASATTWALGAVVAHAWLRDSGGPGGARILMAIGLGPCVAVVVGSVHFFAAASLGAVRPGWFFCLALFSLLILATRIEFPRAEATLLPVRVGPPPTEGWIGRLCVFAAASAAILGIWGGVGLVQAWPAGTWDAVATWNARARLLDRAYPEFLERIPELQHGGTGNYPLGLPAQIAYLTGLSGAGDLEVSAVLCFVFFLSLGTLAWGVLWREGAPAVGAAVAAVLWSTPMAVKWGFSQCADLPLACLFLSTVALLARARDVGHGDGLVLAGLFLGGLLWMKNEGLVLAAVACAIFLVVGSCRLRAQVFPALFRLALGAAPVVLAWAYFKARLAPEGQDFSFYLSGDLAGRLLDVTRWRRVALAGCMHLSPITPGGRQWGFGWATVALGLAATLIARVRGSRLRVGVVWIATCSAALTAQVLTYVATPHDLGWQLRTSLDRLLLQAYPTALVGVALAVLGTTSSEEGRPDQTV